MTPWERFLKDFGDSPQITIVGPMMQSPFAATGPTIYVDGGTQSRIGGSGVPEVSVGDGDSSRVPLDVTLPRNKDFSDLAYVLRSLPPHVREVDLLGFMGGRLDHQLANFGEAAQFLNHAKAFATVRFDKSIIGFAGGSLTLDISGSFSVLVLEPCDVTIRGACDFPLEKPTRLDSLASHGLSNSGEGKVTFTASLAAFVFLVE